MNGCYDSALHLLGTVQKRTISVLQIANPVELRIQPLAHCRNVASLSICYKFFNLPAMSELKMLISVLIDQPRRTRHIQQLHDLAVEIPKSRTVAVLFQL